MKERNSTVECLRIAAMMGVVALHYVNGSIGGLEKYAVYPGPTWFFVSLVKSAAIPMVNAFVLISGFFLIRSSRYSYRKPADLVMTVFFYGIVFYPLSSILLRSAVTPAGLLKSVFPFFFGSAWFIKTYIILLLIVPFLNKLLRSLSLEGYRRLLATQLILFSVWYTAGFSAPLADDGYGIINFITLYLLGGYMGRFGQTCGIIAAFSWPGALACYGGCVLLTLLAGIFVNPYGYAFLTNVCGAAALFLAFVKMPEGNSRLINLLGSNAFDVFFIHTYLFPLLGVGSITAGIMLIPHLLMTVCCCYLAGFLSGSVRKIIMKHTTARLLDRCGRLNREFSV